MNGEILLDDLVCNLRQQPIKFFEPFMNEPNAFIHNRIYRVEHDITQSITENQSTELMQNSRMLFDC